MKNSEIWSSAVLLSLQPVRDKATHVQVNESKISEVANWMAYEEFTKPDGKMLFNFGDDPDFIMDFTLVMNTLNFAFTDFRSRVKFEINYQGKTWCDSEAMVASLHRAHSEGVPFFEGGYLAEITRDQLASVFKGSIEMPMLDERVAILHEVGKKLEESYSGRYHNFVKSCAPKLYSGGEGVLERMTQEFPRFRDVSNYRGKDIQIYKLAQLGIWGMHLALMPRGAWKLEDPNMLTAFADYIVPVGLRVMSIFEYSSELEAKINSGEEIVRDSDAEIELRAQSIYVIARLTDEINRRRVGLQPLLAPQVDYRLWKSYHATHWPHHLTKTVMY